ncbi:MAG: hypothetical protein ACOH5I_20910 [Oligoflexus sp.]
MNGQYTLSSLALQIALVHLFFNLNAVIHIYGAPCLRYLPVKAAERLAEFTDHRKVVAISYVASVFLAMPLIGLSFARFD